MAKIIMEPPPGWPPTPTPTIAAAPPPPRRSAPEPKNTMFLRVAVSPECKQQLNATCERLGMTQISLVSRLIAWHARQGPQMQAATVGMYDGAPEIDAAGVFTAASTALEKNVKRVMSGGATR